jgi:hypothetical protein
MVQRREIIGSVVSTTLSALLSNSATSISVVDGSTFPLGASNKFVIVVDRGKVVEEKILCSSRSANTFTVAERGYDGTTAQDHDSGALVDHVLDALAMQDMNTSVYDNEILRWMGI